MGGLADPFGEYGAAKRKRGEEHSGRAASAWPHSRTSYLTQRRAKISASKPGTLRIFAPLARNGFGLRAAGTSCTSARLRRQIVAAQVPLAENGH